MRSKKMLLLFSLIIVSSNYLTTFSRENDIPLSFTEFQEMNSISSEFEGATFNLSEISIEGDENKEKLIYQGRLPISYGQIYSTVDPVDIEPRLNIIGNKFMNYREVSQENPYNFFTYTNYETAIDKWEIEIYKDSNDVRSLTPIKTIVGTKEDLQEVIAWNGSLNENVKLDYTDKLIYKLRVYDKEGKFDETDYREIELTNSLEYSFNSDETNEELEKIVIGSNNLRRRNIILSGSKVRIYGKNLRDIDSVSINGSNIPVDERGKFLYEDHVKAGEHIYSVDTIGEVENNYLLEVDAPKDYKFLVALADVHIGKNKVTGNTELLEDNYEYNQDFFTQGRLAFYYKQIINDYKITGHADTRNQELKYIFKDFYKRDAQSIFRNLSDDYLDMEYGDNSTLRRDVDTQGKIYLRVDKNKSQALWGNYDTRFSENEFAQYNRTLYGAKFYYDSLQTNSFGDSKYHFKAFISEPETIYSHNEFLGTGGSVYYLDKKDIVSDSAKVYIEIRDPETTRVLKRIFLQEGKDYTVNDLQGRIILARPLPQMIYNNDRDNIIKNTPYSNDQLYLIADYEYYTASNDFSETTLGTRGKFWINDNIQLGATYLYEGKIKDDFILKGFDIKYKKSDISYIRAEYAHSEGQESYQQFYSDNGGLSFEGNRRPTLADYKYRKGSAYLLEGTLAPNEFIDSFDTRDRFDFWYKYKDKGFSKASENSQEEKENIGFITSNYLTENFNIYLGAERYEEEYEDENREKTEEKITAGASYDLNKKTTLTGELEHVDNVESYDNKSEREKALLVGARVDYEFLPLKSVYGEVQTVVTEENYDANNIYTLGTNLQLTERLSVFGEGSTGDRGDTVDFAANYAFNQDFQLYSGYLLESDFGDKEGTFSLGQKWDATERTNVYQENQFIHNDYGNGAMQLYGIDYSFTENLLGGVSFEKGKVSQSEGTFDRTATAFNLAYNSRDFFYKGNIEFRLDKDVKDTDGDKHDQKYWGTTNKARKIFNEEYTVFGEGNYFFADELTTSDSKYLELGLGLAYRPIWNNRLNAITKYSYIRDKGNLGSSDTDGDSKAHIFSTDLTYKLSPKWDVGFRYAIRDEQIRARKDVGPWVSSTIDLFAIKASYHTVYDLEIFGEYHWLRDLEENSQKNGAIAAVYKHINEFFKVGAGYNFSEFDDDLTNLDYEANGWFINFIGKY